MLSGVTSHIELALARGVRRHGISSAPFPGLVCVCAVRCFDQSAQEHSVDYANEGMTAASRGVARYGPGFANLVRADSSCD